MRIKIFFLLLSIMPMVSCRSIKDVPVTTEETQKERNDRATTRVDSVHVVDSVIVHAKGDTVFVEKYRYLYRDRIRNDTVTQIQVRTERQTVEVERSFTRWEVFRMKAFWWLLATSLFLLLYAKRKIIIRIIKTII